MPGEDNHEERWFNLRIHPALYSSDIIVDWVPVSNCSCPHLYLYVVVLELDLKQTKWREQKDRRGQQQIGPRT